MENVIMSIAEKNAELIRRGYKAFNSADMKTMGELFHKDCVWHTPGKGSIAGSRKGRDQVFAHFGRYGSETAGTFQAILKNVAMCEDGRIVGIHRNIGERNGKRLDVDCCIVFDLKDGQLMEGREYFFDLNAWEAFWA